MCIVEKGKGGKGKEHRCRMECKRTFIGLQGGMERRYNREECSKPMGRLESLLSIDDAELTATTVAFEATTCEVVEGGFALGRCGSTANGR